MAEVTLGIGSNIAREENLRSGLEILTRRFSAVKVSPIYESRSVGFDGSNFFNLVMSMSTELELGELAEFLRQLEYSHGRKKNSKKYTSRHLDIDILTFDEVVGEFAGVVLPRDEILLHAFVLKPLSDIAPKRLHPVLHRSYHDLWRAFTGDKKIIWQSDFQWTLNT